MELVLCFQYFFVSYQKFWPMKRKIYMLVTILLPFLVIVFLISGRLSKESVSLLTSNVEALAQYEDGKRSDPVWFVREHGDGAITCTPGGDERCI